MTKWKGWKQITLGVGIIAVFVAIAFGVLARERAMGEWLIAVTAMLGSVVLASRMANRTNAVSIHDGVVQGEGAHRQFLLWRGYVSLQPGSLALTHHVPNQVRVSFCGVPALVDTGAQLHLATGTNAVGQQLHTRASDTNGAELKGFGMGPTRVFKGVRITNPTVGAHVVAPTFVASLADDELPWIFGLPGLIGHTVCLDLAGLRLEVSPSLLRPSWAQGTPHIRIRDGSLIGVTRLGGQPVPVAIDTGAAISSIGPKWMHEAVDDVTASGSVGIQGTIGKESVTRVSGFKLGDSTFPEALMTVRERVDGIILAMDLLGNRILFFDGPSGHAWISPPQESVWERETLEAAVQRARNAHDA